jgi:hypothetical protein
MSKASELHDRVIRVMTFVEKMIPDGVPVPGLVKLDMALKIILRLDTSLVGKESLVKEMFSEAKQTYNEIAALLAAKQQNAGG